MRVFTSLRIASELGKISISLPVALSALTGYAILTGEVGWGGRLLFLGVLLMSCGSGALNQFQERDIDALMERTRNRPVPSGRITPRGALVVAGIFILSGTFILTMVFPVWAVLLSWVTIAWYNLMYTPLKRKSAFAVIPGAVTGALPPMIGWVAAGGSPLNSAIVFVSIFFFIGQIPHFWLLLLLYGDEYDKAGLPSLKNLLNENQIRRITFAWIIAAMASAFLVMFTVIQNRTFLFILLFYSFYLLLSVTLSFYAERELRVRSVFLKLNFLYLFMMVLLIADGLMRRGAG